MRPCFDAGCVTFQGMEIYVTFAASKNCYFSSISRAYSLEEIIVWIR